MPRSRGVTIGVNHNFLFAPVYEDLRRDLIAGKLGRPDQVTITWNRELDQLRSGPFNLWMLREPPNIMLEIGPHCLAPILDLIGFPKLAGGACNRPGGPAGGSQVLPPLACPGRGGLGRDLPAVLIRTRLHGADDPRPGDAGHRHGRPGAEPLRASTPYPVRDGFRPLSDGSGRGRIARGTGSTVP